MAHITQNQSTDLSQKNATMIKEGTFKNHKQMETVLHSSQLISSLTLIKFIFQTDSCEKQCNSSLCHVRTAVNLFCKKRDNISEFLTSFIFILNHIIEILHKGLILH